MPDDENRKHGAVARRLVGAESLQGDSEGHPAKSGPHPGRNIRSLARWSRAGFPTFSWFMIATSVEAPWYRTMSRSPRQRREASAAGDQEQSRRRSTPPAPHHTKSAAKPRAAGRDATVSRPVVRRDRRLRTLRVPSASSADRRIGCDRSRRSSDLES
jgi:hypothetical protein